MGSYAVTVSGGETLTLSAAQANGHDITGGNVLISGDVATSADLTSIGSSLAFQGGSIAVAAGQTLTLTMVQAAGKTITGAGTVLVNGDVASSASGSRVTARCWCPALPHPPPTIPASRQTSPFLAAPR